MPDLKISDMLDEAADKIAPRGTWTRGSIARNFGGEEVNENDPSAVCWCALGALYVVAGSYGVAENAVDVLAAHVGYDDVVEWNDARGRTQSEVVAAFREAARRERERGN